MIPSVDGYADCVLNVAVDAAGRLRLRALSDAETASSRADIAAATGERFILRIRSSP
jgi:hypothetical protein